MHLIYHVRIHIIYVYQNSYLLEKLLNKTFYPLITEASSIIAGGSSEKNLYKHQSLRVLNVIPRYTYSTDSRDGMFSEVNSKP
jgi:hypothetical protein